MSPETLEVLLVNMPFGALRSPCLGLSLLKATIPDRRVKVLYPGLDFASTIEVENYRRIANDLKVYSVAGEWVFSQAVFGELVGSEDEYFEKVLAKEAPDLFDPMTMAALRRARSSVEEFVEATAMRVEALAPKIIGFADSFHQRLASIALTRRLKRQNPDLFVVFGGANCEGIMGVELGRQFPEIDAVVLGEGEVVFPQLVERVLADQSVDDLPGVTTPGNVAGVDEASPPTAPRVASMDDLPLPDHDDFFEQWEASPISHHEQPRLLFETARGCWWGESQHCTFCGLNGTGMAFRSKTSERALEELFAVTGRHPGVPVMVIDRILDMKYFQDFLPELARRGPGVKLFFEVKANLRKDQLRLLHEAGVTEILPGVESFSDPILKMMRKGETALQNIRLLKWSAELGIWPVWYFIWGFPFEPQDEYQRMAGLLPLLSHLPPPDDDVPIELVRFSPNFDEAETQGIVDIEPRPGYRFVYPFAEEAVKNLAWYFTFRYTDERQVDDYTHDVRGAIDDWRKIYDTSQLVHLHRGDELWIFDFRPSALRTLTTLDGLDRWIHLACDDIRTLDGLTRDAPGHLTEASARDSVEAAVEAQVESGLMVRDGDRVLSLSLAGDERRKEGSDEARGAFFITPRKDRPQVDPARGTASSGDSQN